MKANAILCAQFLGMVLLALAPYLDGTLSRAPLVPETNVQLFAIGLYFLGTVACLLAILELKGNFTIHAAPRAGGDLVTSGIYSLTRNPIYFGGLLMFLGWALYFASPLAFLFTALETVVLVLKISLEERNLSAKFGQGYALYRIRTKALIPYIF